MMLRLFLSILVFGSLWFLPQPVSAQQTTPWWTVQSIDTMKYSRDLAREKAPDPAFDTVIETQVNAIAQTGATHVAIGTPYETEFVPFMKRWVAAARRHGLKVWFRGNTAGWEHWFGYPRITREQHTQQIKTFILNHSDLFQDGDIFSSCPECENGGPGDPRMIGDKTGHQAFLISEYQVVKATFQEINKQVAANYYSMNGDVARLVMDPATTKALDGLVAVDHYVPTVEQLVKDLKEFRELSGGQVVLSEFGVPVPDLQGTMTPEAQADWLEALFKEMALLDGLVGVNYWVNVGGSTRLWDDSGVARPAVSVLKRYFMPPIIFGVVKNTWGEPVNGASVSSGYRFTTTDTAGTFTMPYLKEASQELVVTTETAQSITHPIENPEQAQTITLPAIESVRWFSRFRELLMRILTFR